MKVPIEKQDATLFNNVKWQRIQRGIIKIDSAFFETNDRESYDFTKRSKNMYAPGSFRDKTVYIFKHRTSNKVYKGTMKQIATMSFNNEWHKGSWCGTQLIKRLGSQRSLLIFLGKAS